MAVTGMSSLVVGNRSRPDFFVKKGDRQADPIMI
jgi:hypothetical protein